MKLLKKLAAAFAGATALAFSSCSNLGLDNNSFQNKVSSYFVEMTSSAAVALYEIAPNDTVKNKAGVDCVPASGEHVVSFYLRNPQKYRFGEGNMTLSLAGMAEYPSSLVTIAQDPDDSAKINITYDQSFLLEHPLGTDISPKVELFHPVSHKSFGVFDKMKISSDSPPPSVQLACFQRDGATENDHYVVCFYLPDVTKFANSYSSEGKTDVHTFYINGTKKYLNVADKKIYNSATVDDEGNWTFTDEDTSISGTKPSGLQALSDEPNAFAFTGTEADYQSAYVAKYMTLPETIGYYGDNEVTYSLALEDDAGLSAGMATSNKASRLSAPILLNAEDGAEIESGTDASHYKPYGADEETMYFTLRIVHDGKDAEGRPCGSVNINYTITEKNGEPVFGGSDTLRGTASGSATIKLPKGKYDIQATASKNYYITSLKKDADYVQITKSAVYFVSQTGDNSKPGSKAEPYKTVQWAIQQFMNGIYWNEYEENGVCKIYVMSDLYPEAETDFTADGSDPENKSLIAIGGSGWAATVNIIGYGGTRTIDANGSYFDSSSATVHRVMRVDGGHLVLENINLAGGYATNESLSKGMGTGLLALNNGTTVKYTGGSVYNNDTYTARGAGIYISNAKVELNNVTIRDNGKRLENQGGSGLCAEDAADVTMTNCNVIDNGVSEIMSGAFSHYGGGIYFNGVGAKLYIKGGSIKGNKLRVSGSAGVPSPTNASYGGGIWMYYGDLILEGVTITGNESYNGGAGIYQKIYDNDTGTLTIKGGAGGVKTTIYDNYTAGTTTQSNLYITLTSTTPTAYKTITIDGNIGQSKIGVSVPFTDTFKPVAGESKNFTSGYNYPATNAKKPGEVFVAENGYGIALNGVEAAFAVSSASSYSATDYTFTPTLRTDCAPSVYPGATKTFVINDFIGKRKVAGSSPVSYDSMYLDPSALTLFTISGTPATNVYDPTGKTVSISAALYSGGTKVRDATVDSSDARRITLVAKTAGDAAILPPGNYTLKVFVEFLGIKHEANILIAVDYSAETVADYISGLSASPTNPVIVKGTVGPGMDYSTDQITSADDGLAKVAKAIKNAASGVMISLDARETNYVPAPGNQSDDDYNPLANYNNNSYFAGCAKLKEMYLPDWMKGLVSRDVGSWVYEGLFEGCSGLTKIVIPDTVTAILNNAFKGCSNLASITFGGTSAEWKKIEFGENWRSGVTQTDKVHCAGDNTDVPFGFFEVSYIKGSPAVGSATIPVSGSGTEADPFIAEGSVASVTLEVDTDDATSGYTTATGVSCSEVGGLYVLMFDRNSMGDLPASGYWTIEVNFSCGHVYFKIMPVTTAAVPEGFVDFKIPAEGKSFTIGYSGYSNTTPHIVTLKRNFWMCDHEVTQAEYTAVMETNPSMYNGSDGYEPADGETQSERPVEQISWYAAITYCNKRSIAENLDPCYTVSGVDFTGTVTVPTTSTAAWNNASCDFTKNGYRLPTEAEWEFAARGIGFEHQQEDTSNKVWAGTNTEDDLVKYAWYSLNADSKTHAVKTDKTAGVDSRNAAGLYDMSGNVAEWCWDFRDDSYYSAESQTDPTGGSPGSDYYRVKRGGTYVAYETSDLAIAYRGQGAPHEYMTNSTGIRVVRTAPNP